MYIILLPFLFMASVFQTWVGTIVTTVVCGLIGYGMGHYLTMQALVVCTIPAIIVFLATVVYFARLKIKERHHGKGEGFTLLFAGIFLYICFVTLGVAWYHFYTMTDQTFLADAYDALYQMLRGRVIR